MTGLDYILYRDYSIDRQKVLEKFHKKLKSIWPSALKEEWEDPTSSKDKVELFFSKDKDMYERHDEFGFYPDENGESCFLIVAVKKNNIDEKVISTYEDGSLSGEIDIKLSKLQEWTIVLPERLTENNFSSKIYHLLLESIDDQISNRLAKPVQYYINKGIKDRE
ncbi:hypothetical protein [Algivirga pacifica]|uniref:Uncharacterized protein n=1 Tax=Algivirga pacifica TaxID=1162670 RepID=A0ABP9DGN2_9BACT